MGIGIALGLLAGADAAFAQFACQWTGAGADNKWSMPGNWGNCGAGMPDRTGAPQNGDRLMFRDGAATAASINDLDHLRVAGLVLDGAAIDGAGWDLSGNDITLIGSLLVQDIPDQAPAHVRMKLTIGAPLLTIQNLQTGAVTETPLVIGDVDLNGFTLIVGSFNPIDVTGTISGQGQTSGIRVIGGPTAPAVLQLEHDSTYQGSTSIESSRVLVSTPAPFGPTAGGATAVVTDGSALVLGDHATLAASLQCQGVVRVFGSDATMTGTLSADAASFLIFDTSTAEGRLTLTGPIAATDAGPQVAKSGDGTLVLANAGANKDRWTNLLLVGGTVQIGADDVVPHDAEIRIAGGTLDVGDFHAAIGILSTSAGTTIRLGTGTLTVNQTLAATVAGTIIGRGNLIKKGSAALQIAASNSYTGETTVNEGILALISPVGHAVVGPLIINTGGTVTTDGAAAGTQFGDQIPVTIAGGTLMLSGAPTAIGSLAGESGTVSLRGSVLTLGADNSSTTFGGGIDGAGGIVKIGTGVLTLTGANTQATTTVTGGTLIVNGSLRDVGTVTVGVGATLSGGGSVGTLASTGGIISPGPGSTVQHPIGTATLHAAAATLTDGMFVAEINGLDPGTGYDQLALTGNLVLGGAVALQATLGFEPHKGVTFTLINVAAGQTVTGTFMGLAEGATLHVGDRQFTISYAGGDGNDVVVTAADDPPPFTYYLSEGATGGFFDEDVLIANPHDTAAPVTLTFSKEDGTQVIATRTVPAQARLTVHVDQIAGLESTAVSAQVSSDFDHPVVVERTMFWDPSYYAGHTGTAVDKPGADWFFAEGSQGFFNTFVLVINPNTTPTDVTFTFFREQEPAVVKTITVGATTRLTLFAGDVPDLVDRSFGIAVHATQPIMAERSMYFGTRPDGQLSGGTESAGVTALSTHWFMAEGATGGFYDTFILLSNPQSVEAHAQLQYLLPSGETITVPKTIAAHARLTTNIEAEDDPRLQNAAVSTVVTSDQPIIAERSMYWLGAATPWGEGHNSFGVVDAGTRWGLSEGRIGGPHNFHTYILLANPQTTAAEVTVHYLRESGAPIAKTYTVGPTSRFNIDTSEIAELHDESFGAIVDVTNNVNIIVERSMYWDANGFQFSGGTNATGIRLP
jgi:autotransporter-associated beta strand protein